MGIFCRDYIASHSKQNHQAPENEHQAEKATARGITPERLNISKKINLIFNRHEPKEKAPQGITPRVQCSYF